MARAKNLPRNWNLEHSLVTLATLAVRDIGAERVKEKQLVQGRKRVENKANAIPPQKCGNSHKLVIFCLSAAVIVLGLGTFVLFVLLFS